MREAVDPALARISALLEEERRCLLSGDLAGLEALAAEKRALAGTLGGAPDRRTADPGRDIARLGAAAQRNQRLLEAAAEGLRSAMRRVTELHNLHRGRGTYGAGGLRAESAESARIERRV